MKNKEILHLISKSFGEDLNTEEQNMLNDWITQSNKNKVKYDGYRRLWSQSEALDWSNEIDVESALYKTKQQIRELKKNKYSNRFLLKAVASVLVLLSTGLGLGYFLSSYSSGEDSDPVVFKQVESMYGTNTKLLLSDGTSVWLNSGSKLSFPISFEGAEQRKVVLTGEAYFEVTKNSKKAFIVETVDVDIRVHGTSFNVSAYGDEKSVIVALVEGKVSLEKELEGDIEQLVMLKPDEVVSLDKKSQSVTRLTDMKMSQFTGWKEGMLVFYGDSIGTVAKRLEKWYNVAIEIEESLSDYRFTATIQNESLEQVLDLLSMSSPMKYKIIPAKLKEDKTFSQRRVKLSMRK